jgi:putative endonuclease
MEKPATWFCYMLRCKDGSLYVGVAMDPMHRVRQHNWGVGAKFTAKRRPVELIWWEKLPDLKAARQREVQLKAWRREKKLSLLTGFGDRVYPSAAKSATSG